MLDISFGEFLLIGTVALVVLGPERLPVVARTLGALLGRAQRFVAGVKADIQSDADMGSLIGLHQEVRQTADAFRDRIEAELAEVRESVVPEALPLPEAGPVPVATPDAGPAPRDQSQLDLFEELLPPSHRLVDPPR